MGKTLSILVALDPEPEPVPNVRIRPKRSGSDRIRNTDRHYDKIVSDTLK
jgi:hypothetical protein